jgi:hypothetical protein
MTTLGTLVRHRTKTNKTHQFSEIWTELAIGSVMIGDRCKSLNVALGRVMYILYHIQSLNITNRSLSTLFLERTYNPDGSVSYNILIPSKYVCSKA